MTPERASNRLVAVIAVSTCASLLFLLGLRAWQLSPTAITYVHAGLRIWVPDGWINKTQEVKGVAKDSPLVLVTSDSSRMMMLWLRSRQESPPWNADSRRLRWMAARYARFSNAPINRWQAPKSLTIEDVFSPTPIRDAKQLYIISASSPLVEACLYVFSYREPGVPPAMRKLAYELLRSIKTADGTEPFGDLTRTALKTTRVQPSVDKSIYTICNEEITLPGKWIAEDMLLIGMPGGGFDRSATEATVSLIYTRGVPGQVPSVMVSWAREGCAGQSAHGFGASLRKSLDNARTSAVLISRVPYAHSGGSDLWRMERQVNDADRHVVHWICVTDEIAFEARGLSRNQSSMLEQQKLVVTVLDQLLKP